MQLEGVPMVVGFRARAAVLGVSLSLTGALALIAIGVIRSGSLTNPLNDLNDFIGSLFALLAILVIIALVYGVPGAVVSLGAAVALRALRAKCPNTLWRLLAVAIGALGGYGVGSAGDVFLWSSHPMLRLGTIPQVGLCVGAIWGVLAPGILFSPRAEPASLNGRGDR